MAILTLHRIITLLFGQEQSLAEYILYSTTKIENILNQQLYTYKYPTMLFYLLSYILPSAFSSFLRDKE